MKLYLSGPMRGLPNENYHAFNEYALKLRVEGYTVYNPAEEEPGLSRRAYFRSDMTWICNEAQVIAMMPGWEHSNGAQAEWWLAKALDLKIIYLT